MVAYAYVPNSEDEKPANAAIVIPATGSTAPRYAACFSLSFQTYLLSAQISLQLFNASGSQIWRFLGE